MDEGVKGNKAVKNLLTEKDFERVTGRSEYFSPEVNVDHRLLLTNWRVVERFDNIGLEFDVLKVDGEEYGVGEKRWTVTSKRANRELEPIIKAAQRKGKSFIHILFRQSLGRGENVTEAKFVAWNLDDELDELLEPEQRSDKAPMGVK